MGADRIVTLAVLCVTLLATPGPATITLAACGANLGVRRSVPYVLGLTTGVLVSLALAVAGVGVFLVRAPGALLALQIGSACYLLYLACQLVRKRTLTGGSAAGPGGADGTGGPDGPAGGRAEPGAT
ncbi:LysE family translocator, partial [Actinomadura yumaensis]